MISGIFRISLYKEGFRGRGIGTWATEVTCDFAFEKLKLDRLYINVYSFNKKAERVYLKTGFKIECILRDAIMDQGKYYDDILMAIIGDGWRKLKE